MRHFLVFAFIFFISCVPIAEARWSGSIRSATPIFEDQTVKSETFSVDCGTTAPVKLHTPRSDITVREERHLRIQNTSGANLHITTYTASHLVITASMTVNSFIIPTGEYLDLSPKTTWYGEYDLGESSYPVRVQVDFHDSSGD